MIQTKILTDDDPLDAVLAGAEKLYKAVSVTMGPRGRNVIFKMKDKRVGVTHDGVTVAKLVRSNLETEQPAIEIMQEAAKKLDATTGDGTTTVTVLTYHILKEAAKHIKDGESPMRLKLAIEALQDDIIKQIEAHTDKDVTLEKLQAVASVAAGSKEIGESVGKIVSEAGKDTPIMLGFSESDTTHAEVIDGFKIDSGAASHYLMEGAGVRLEINQPKVIVVDAKLRDKEDVGPILRLIAAQPQDQRDFLLVCSDIAGDALSLLVINHLKGFARIACARVPQHINSHSEYLSDVAVSCGAQVLSRNTGHTLREPSLDDFGACQKVTVEPRETVIIGGRSIKEDFNTRLEQLKDLKENGKTSAARKFASDRLMTLEQKVISIFVGGQSETDAEERHYRYEDAVGACRAALRGGVVPGGGTLLYMCGLALLGKTTAVRKPLGVEGSVLSEALMAPLTTVLGNAGIKVPTVIGIGRGVDVMHPEDGVIGLVERGILDPAESEIECVKTAIAVAGLLMSAGAEIVEEGEYDAPTEQPFSVG